MSYCDVLTDICDCGGKTGRFGQMAWPDSEVREGSQETP